MDEHEVVFEVAILQVIVVDLNRDGCIVACSVHCLNRQVAFALEQVPLPAPRSLFELLVNIPDFHLEQLVF